MQAAYDQAVGRFHHEAGHHFKFNGNFNTTGTVPGPKKVFKAAPPGTPGPSINGLV